MAKPNAKLTDEEIAALQQENADLKAKQAAIETANQENDAILADAKERVSLSGGILPMEVAIKCARDQAAWNKDSRNPNSPNYKPPTEPAKA